MPLVKFTKNLQRFFPHIRTINVDGETVTQVVAALDQRYPGLAGYLLDDRGALREHVNIFVNEELIRDRQTLSDALGTNDQVYVLQALSGG